MTLAETLTASSLLTLVMGMTFGALQPGLSIYRQDEAQGNLDQLAIVVARQIGAELEAGNRDSLSFDGESLSFLRYDGYDAHSGQPIWDHYRVWWRDSSDNSLHAADLTSPRYPSLSPYPMTPAEAALPRTNERTCLHGVTAWQATQAQGTVNFDLTLNEGGGSSHCQACVRMRL